MQRQFKYVPYIRHIAFTYIDLFFLYILMSSLSTVQAFMSILIMFHKSIYFLYTYAFLLLQIMTRKQHF